MPQEISFENFKFTERDRYRKIRKGNSDIGFSYLSNYVIADMDDRVLAIDVDDHFIKMEEKLDGDEKPEDWKHPYMPHADKIVASPIGEQLIAFCEVGFKELIKESLLILQIQDALKAETKKSPPTVVNKPTTKEELDILYYENYEYLRSVAEDVIASCLYVNIFPPLVSATSTRMFKTYFTYLLALQEEYIRLLNFCFDMDFYAEELDGINAASRFHIYCGTTDAVPTRDMNMSFRFTRRGFGNVSTTVRDKAAVERLKQNPAQALNIPSREQNAFEKAYNINPTVTELARIVPIPIASSYSCSSLEDMLFLEFEKMLELDMRIKKCKNCGRYFVLKGNYQTEYCDRIPDGETQNCQSLGALAKYAQKVKDNPALAIFNRAYKRYHARVKAGSVKREAFKKWKYEAVVMRDRCVNGEVEVVEFEVWIDTYFG